MGEQRALPLRALATAGYTWAAAVTGENPSAVEVTLDRGELPPGAPPGLSVPERVVVRGVRPGRARVRLSQRRSWESDRPPARLVELDVAVVPASETEA